MAKTMRIDKEKRQVIIDLPNKRMSVPQRLTINDLVKKGKAAELAQYIGHFSSAKPGRDRIKPVGADQMVNAKWVHAGKALPPDVMKNRRSNSILDKFYSKCDVFADGLSPSPVSEKYPAGKAVGVEIECYLPISRDEVREALALSPIPNVRCGTDSSISPDEKSPNYHTMEFRVLTNIDNMTNLEKLCDFLHRQGARVNTSCGMHIHLDFRNKNDIPWEVVKRFEACLEVLKAMVPSSRLESSYCQGDTSTGGRRAKINSESFYKYKTIEIRLHSGTANYRKIANWIRLCHSIAFTDIAASQVKEHLKEHPLVEQPSILAKYFGWIDSKSYLLDYMLERCATFNPSSFPGIERPAQVKGKRISKDDELDASPSEIAAKRAELKKKYADAYQAWVVWLKTSRSKHCDRLRVWTSRSEPLRGLPDRLVKAELERQLEIKEDSITNKDFSAFYSSFYMYDKRKGKACQDRLPYLKLYFEKFPDLYLKVVNACPKAVAGDWENAQVPGLNAAFGGTSISGDLQTHGASNVYANNPELNRILDESMNWISIGARGQVTLNNPGQSSYVIPRAEYEAMAPQASRAASGGMCTCCSYIHDTLHCPICGQARDNSPSLPTVTCTRCACVHNSEQCPSCGHFIHTP